MDVRQFGRKGGVETLVELVNAYETSGDTTLAQDPQGKALLTSVFKALRDGWDAVSLDEFPVEQAITSMMLATNETEDVAGLCLMCTVATNDWQVLRGLCNPIIEPSDKWPSKFWGTEYLAGMLLGVFESLAWIYLPRDRKHYFTDSGNRYALYPPDFLADLLTSETLNTCDDVVDSHPVFGEISNLAAHIVSGPGENPDEHRVHIDHMLWRIRNSFYGMRDNKKSPSILAELTVDRLVSKRFYEVQPATRLEWVGYRIDMMPGLVDPLARQ
ncbi:MAG: hypothetical protein NTZ65_03885 [Candidatus Berkelbacteria bacterium]|nr:hypothetical protein [Candidatus Berkelbacteria bacterium]